MAYKQKQVNLFSFDKARRVTARASRKEISFFDKSPDKCLFHLVYHANIDDIIKYNGLNKAYPVALRFFHADENGRLNAYEIDINNKTHRFIFSEINYGPLVEEQKELVEELEMHKLVDGLEHVFLRLANLKIKAVWFRGKTRDLDYYAPLSPCFYGLKAGKLYTSAKFIPIVVKAAKQILKIFSQSAEDDLLGG